MYCAKVFLNTRYCPVFSTFLFRRTKSLNGLLEQRIFLDVASKREKEILERCVKGHYFFV
jgi:hypothetical protein